MKDQEEIYGRQYPGDNAFKKAARLHQSKFRVEELGKPKYRKYGNRLIAKDALSGNNFYTKWPGLFEQVQARYDLKNSPLYYDMLRSEHIPFNLFGPLVDEPELAKLIFNPWVSGAINEVRNIRFEYAPKPRNEFLDDYTAFDLYVEYMHIDKKTIGGIGIEIKFTEGAYSYGKKEKARMFDQDSIYNKLTKDSNLYLPEKHKTLKDRAYKQLWRNQLLGLSMMDHAKFKISHFLLVVIYPEGNKHYSRYSSEYENFIQRDLRQKSFWHVTYEEYLRCCGHVIDNENQEEWLKYLSMRYIVD